MEQSQCDVCGGLVSAAIPATPAGEEPAGLVCEACLETRSVRPDPKGANASARSRPGRFECPFCGRRLRSKAVRARVETACPNCGGSIVLAPGGMIEVPPGARVPGGAVSPAPTDAAPAAAADGSEDSGPAPASPADLSSAPPLEAPPPLPEPSPAASDPIDVADGIDKGAFDALAQSDDFELLSPPPKRRDSGAG